MSRPRTVYRGRRRYRWILTLVLFLIAIALVASVWLFYHLQKYIEYDKESVKLVVPFLPERVQDDEEEPEPEYYVEVHDPVNAEVVVGATDYSSKVTTAGQGLESIKGYYIYGDYVSASSIEYYVRKTTTEQRGAIILQLKKPDGSLCYLSGVSNVSSYGVNGREMIDDAVAAAKESGVYMVAEISALLDTLMAERNAPISLKDSATGFPAKNEQGAWLDPYNDGTREYIGGIIRELARLGFDEVILSNLVFPQIAGVGYSQAMSGAPDRVSAISSFAFAMREVAEEVGIKLSVKCDETSLRVGSSNNIGQDIAIFFKAFDRVYFESSVDNIASDTTALAGFLGSVNQNRIVPMFSGQAPEWESYVIR